MGKSKAKTGRGRKNKGKVGERELAGEIQPYGWPCRRGQQRSGVDQADVIDGPPGWHIECKRVEKLNLWAAWKQANTDAPGGTIPMVATRRNNSEWLAIVSLHQLLWLIWHSQGSSCDSQRPSGHSDNVIPAKNAKHTIRSAAHSSAVLPSDAQTLEEKHFLEEALRGL